MAEFQEVIEQWKRRCEHCEKHENVKCDINGYVCGGFDQMRQYINPEFIERDVMSWAAKKPKPVYPTWMEWLAANVPGVDADSIYEAVRVLNRTRIPADIAQKLGLEPEEG